MGDGESGRDTVIEGARWISGHAGERRLAGRVEGATQDTAQGREGSDVLRVQRQAAATAGFGLLETAVIEVQQALAREQAWATAKAAGIR